MNVNVTGSGNYDVGQALSKMASFRRCLRHPIACPSSTRARQGLSPFRNIWSKHMDLKAQLILELNVRREREPLPILIGPDNCRHLIEAPRSCGAKGSGLGLAVFTCGTSSLAYTIEQEQRFSEFARAVSNRGPISIYLPIGLAGNKPTENDLKSKNKNMQHDNSYMEVVFQRFLHMV